MPNKTIFALGANVALDKANDIFHLWQPGATGEKDRKATIQSIIDLLDVNTSFANVPYLDKANTFAAENIFTGRVTVGEVNPGATYPLEIYSSTVDIAARIQTALSNGIAGIVLENDAQSWEPRVDTNDNFVLRDITNSLSPIQVEPGAPTNSHYIQADGHEGHGRLPTTEFDFYRASEDIVFLIETAKVGGNASIYLKNDAQTWLVGVHASDVFRIQDVDNVSTPFVIEIAVPTNSLYIATTGVGVNTATPGTDLDVAGTLGLTVGLTIPTSNNAGILYLRRRDVSISANNNLGRIDFTGDDATAVNTPAASIHGSADGTWTGGTDTPGRLSFWTAPATTGVLAERLRITSVGSILKGTITSLHSTTPTIESLGTWAIIGRSISTDDLAKETAYGLTQKDNEEEPFTMLYGVTSTSNNTVSIGGNFGSGNAATIISLFTAADNITLTGTEALRITNAQNMIINGSTDVPGARLQIGGTDAALLLSRLTTTERNALTPVNGMIIYNTTTGVLEAYESGAWVDL